MDGNTWGPAISINIIQLCMSGGSTQRIPTEFQHCIYLYTDAYSTSMSMNTDIHVCAHGMCACTYLCRYRCLYTCMYTYIFLYMYIYIYICDICLIWAMGGWTEQVYVMYAVYLLSGLLVIGRLASVISFSKFLCVY